MAEHDHDYNQIAVIGLYVRFPGAADYESFWRNLRDGVESIVFHSEEELRDAGVPEEWIQSPRFVPASASLPDIDRFDASFFGFSPREAEVMDPQFRLFLEGAWSALEDAGCDPHRFPGSVGVCAGVGSGSYLQQNVLPNRHRVEGVGGLQVSISNAADSLATLVSYKLDLTGPSLTVQTACSSSLVAVHVACQCLLNGECDLMLAGGVSLKLAPPGYVYQEGNILSRDGHCRAFDAKASGTVAGSGMGIVVLKRMEEAEEQGDNVRAVILGSAVGNDGASKAGFTAPSVLGHARVVTEALTVAGVEPQSIGYVETHGTGTNLGDPVEIEALTQSFSDGTQERNYCAVGSVKTNIGHLDHAAGVASLVKTVLSLENRRIPPSLHFETPNPKIDFEASPFFVNTRLRPWPSNDSPRRAGVSSLGMGGTNAHVILQEAPARQAVEDLGTHQLIVLSARSEAALERATDNLAQALRDRPELRLSDVAFTLQAGRRKFSCRRTLVANDREEAAQALEGRDPSRVRTALMQPRETSCAFLFPGQGSQYPGMTRGLYERYRRFRDDVDTCCRELESHLGFDLRDLLYPEADGFEAAGRRLRDTRITQPALFVVEYALARLWMSWGVRPKAMIGHSIGEYVAACLSGVFEPGEALALVARRGELMGRLPSGAMMAVPLEPTQLEPLLDESLAIAAVNAPRQSVVSGSHEAVDRLTVRLEEMGVGGKRLETSHAFHSPMMDPILEAFAATVGGVALAAPKIPFLSNLTGTWITKGEATDPSYWRDHLRETVLFAKGLETLLPEAETLLEVGPGRTLGALARRHPAAVEGCRVLASLRHPQEKRGDEETVLETAGRLWSAGVDIDWPALHEGTGPRRVSLPTYPFERERYWLEAPSSPTTSAGRQGRLDKSPNIEEWIYLPVWRSTAVPLREPETLRLDSDSRWLVFGGAGAASDQLLSEWRRLGLRFIEVRAGNGFAESEEASYTICPGRREDYVRLLQRLTERGHLPDEVIHLWTLSLAEDGAPYGELEGWRDLGFSSLVYLVQALDVLGTQCFSQLKVITSATAAVLEGDVVSPSKAMMKAACLVIEQEHPTLSCRIIDVDLRGNEPSLLGTISRRLWAELGMGNTEPLVAYRCGTRFTPGYERVRKCLLAPSPQPLLRDGGVYLITGGLGNVGLHIAEFLARRFHAKIVLTGRTSLPESDRWDWWSATHAENDPVRRRIEAVRRMESHGAEVQLLQVDVGDAEAMRGAVGRIKERFGMLHGVIHAAGVLDGSTLCTVSDISRDECDRQFRSKVSGVRVLDEVLEGEGLDFVLLMSSLSTVVGGVGFGVYAAANAFMDAYAQEQHRRGKTQWMSVNWDGWRGASGESTRRTEVSRLAMTPAEGTEALARILSVGRQSRVFVSTAELEARIEQWTTRSDGASRAGDSSLESVESRYRRPNLANVYVAPEGELEERLAGIWGALLGIDRVGMHDNFFELGGTSLLAIQMMTKLEEELGVKVSTAALFEGPTVHAMSRLIASVQEKGS